MGEIPIHSTGCPQAKLDENPIEWVKPNKGTCQSYLGLVLKDLGDLEGAKGLLSDAYESFKNLLGENHPNTLTVKSNLEFVELEIQKR